MNIGAEFIAQLWFYRKKDTERSSILQIKKRFLLYTDCHKKLFHWCHR